MTWLRLDDNAMDDPRIRQAGREAGWLHAWGMSYAARHLSDGHIPAQVIGDLRGGTALAQRLVAVGLWHKTPQGYFIPCYLEWNPSGTEIKERRAKDAERKRQGFRTESSRDAEGNPTGFKTSRPKAPSSPGNKGAEDLQATDGDLTHIEPGSVKPEDVPVTTAEKYAELILPMIGEVHRREYWLEQFRDAPQAAVVDAVEEFEIALAGGKIKNRAGYFTQIFQRHCKELADPQAVSS